MYGDHDDGDDRDGVQKIQFVIPKEILEDLKIKGPGSFNLEHRIHMALFSHPHRVKRLPLKYDQELKAFQRKWVENWFSFFDPFWILQQLGDSWLQETDTLVRQRRAIEEFNKQYWWLDQYDTLTLLQQELIINGFKKAMEVDDGRTLIDVAMETALHPRHAELGFPLRIEEIVAILLFTCSPSAQEELTMAQLSMHENTYEKSDEDYNMDTLLYC